jgi:hypothetical protein
VATAISVPPGHGAGGCFEDLVDFRERLYGCLTKRGDAMFGVVTEGRAAGVRGQRRGCDADHRRDLVNEEREQS